MRNIQDGVKATKKASHGRLFDWLQWQLLLAQHTETLVELVDTTTGINNFLSTSVERVTCTANVQVQSFACSRVYFDDVATSTSCSDFCVFRMDTWFHWGLPQVKAMSLFQPEVGHHMRLISKVQGAE